MRPLKTMGIYRGKWTQLASSLAQGDSPPPAGFADTAGLWATCFVHNTEGLYT